MDLGGSDLRAKLTVGRLAVAWGLGPERGSGANLIEGANFSES